MGIFTKSPTTINISTETILKAIGFTFGFFILLSIVDNVRHQLTLVGVAAFLALALNPAVTYITNKLKSKSRVRGTGMAYLMVLTVLTGFLTLVVPPLVRQTSAFVSDLPETIDNFLVQDSPASSFVRRYNLDNQLDKFGQDVKKRLGDNAGQTAYTTVTRVGGTLVSVITVLVLTFMMLVEGPIWLEKLMSVQPASKRAKRREILGKMYRVVTNYVNGQVLIASIAASFALVALLLGNVIFDTQVNAVAMTGIVLLFGLIPMFGNILGASIVVLVTLFSSGSLAIMMAVFFIIYQQIENISLQPYIQSRGNHLTPLAVFIAALLGVGLGGILGALAAIPVAGCLKILIDEYLETHSAKEAS